MSAKKMPTREEVYDTQINPLMAQIIEICQAHGIPILASFQLDNERGPDRTFLCTTSILPPDASVRLQAAAQLILRGFAGLVVEDDLAALPPSPSKPS